MPAPRGAAGSAACPSGVGVTPGSRAHGVFLGRTGSPDRGGCAAAASGYQLLVIRISPGHQPPDSGRQRGGPEVAAEGDARISSLHAGVVTGSACFARHLWWHGDSCSTQTPTPHSWARVLTPPRHQGGHEAAAPPSHEPGCCGVSPGCCSWPLGTDRLLPRAGKQRGAFAPRARGAAAGSGAELRQCPGGSKTRVPARPRGCPSSCAGAGLPCSGAATRLCHCGRLRASHAVSSSIQPLSHANDCQHAVS